ncbi:TadE/TadG family type IV pilus assembly protein [Erwinia sp. 9145]|uniref:TadE/TadG family type IV pilus assembly protein n=1 Tax=Erwinia sp. 9145 TaxID=1500895 RepID=UPI000554131B|nr:TadE/TadG family type IV pilus assembly protein [Erwinia sp. 9145]
MRLLFQRLTHFYRDKKGIAAIEFSLVIIVFIFFTFFIFEISRYMFVSSAIDLTLAESARITSSRLQKKADYAAIFHHVVAEQSRLWSTFIDGGNYHVTILYCHSIAQAVNGECNKNEAAGKALAIYQVQYDYQPLLFNGAVAGSEKLISALKSSLTRRLVLVQEYEREEVFRDDQS